MSNNVDSESKKDFKNITEEDRMNFFKMLMMRRRNCRKCRKFRKVPKKFDRFLLLN